jgi:hypothetical protein
MKVKLLPGKYIHQNIGYGTGRFVTREDGLIRCKWRCQHKLTELKKALISLLELSPEILIVLIKLMTLRGCPTIVGVKL